MISRIENLGQFGSVSMGGGSTSLNAAIYIRPFVNGEGGGLVGGWYGRGRRGTVAKATFLPDQTLEEPVAEIFFGHCFAVVRSGRPWYGR